MEKEEIMTKYAFSLCAALALTLQSWAAPSLTVNDAKELVITAPDGAETTRLTTGSIGKQITSGNQVFKVSYGKDLRGRTNIIIYPDPEKPQSLDLNILGQAVKISSDAVLTVIDDGTGALSQFQAGMVGTVTVSGQPLTAGSSAKVAQGQVSTVAPNEQVFPEPPKPAAPAAPGEGEPEVQTTSYDGLKVRTVEGDVMWAPPGKDVLEMVKTATNMPRLQVDQTLTSGSSIQTGPNGKAMISPFPGCVIAVQPNTTIILEDAQYKKANGDYSRKMHLNLKEGGVISTVKGIKPEYLDYQVKTPLAVAAIRGSVQGVWGDNNKVLIIAAESNTYVSINGPPVVTMTLKEGNKLLITRDGVPQEFNATPEEITAFKTLVESIKALLAASDITAEGDQIGGGPRGNGNLPDVVQTIRERLRQTNPRLNDIFMTPIVSPQTL
jgi:hypothetical protein